MEALHTLIETLVETLREQHAIGIITLDGDTQRLLVEVEIALIAADLKTTQEHEEEETAAEREMMRIARLEAQKPRIDVLLAQLRAYGDISQLYDDLG